MLSSAGMWKYIEVRLSFQIKIHFVALSCVTMVVRYAKKRICKCNAPCAAATAGYDGHKHKCMHACMM